MCGRFAFYSAAEAVNALFGVDDESLSVRPQYNIAPTDPAAVVREDEQGERRLSMLRWGLVPFWAGETARQSRRATTTVMSCRANSRRACSPS